MIYHKTRATDMLATSVTKLSVFTWKEDCSSEKREAQCINVTHLVTDLRSLISFQDGKVTQEFKIIYNKSLENNTKTMKSYFRLHSNHYRKGF